MQFIVGLDLGQASDYTAAVVLERHPQERPIHYQLRHLERFPLRTSYPDIVTHILGLLASPPLSYSTPLVIDQTGVGRPVTDLFTRKLGRQVVPVSITGGMETNETPDGWKVPKRDLVSTVQACLQTGRLKFAASLPLVEVLVEELTNFQVKISETAHESYGAWREGTHDDLLLALALALWHGERPQPDPLLGLVFGFGVQSAWGGGGGSHLASDRHIVGRRDSSGLWTGQPDGAPGRLLDALNQGGR